MNPSGGGKHSALRFLRCTVGLSSAALMAHAVDVGFITRWKVWQQGAWFLTMIVLGAFGLGPVLRLVGRDERLAWLPLIAVLWLGFVLPIAWQLQVRLGIPYLSTYSFAFALTLAYGASWS